MSDYSSEDESSYESAEEIVVAPPVVRLADRRFISPASSRQFFKVGMVTLTPNNTKTRPIPKLDVINIHRDNLVDPTAVFAYMHTYPLMDKAPEQPNSYKVQFYVDAVNHDKGKIHMFTVYTIFYKKRPSYGPPEHVMGIYNLKITPPHMYSCVMVTCSNFHDNGVYLTDLDKLDVIQKKVDRRFF